MRARILAVDWSGAVSGAASKIWVAEARDGNLLRLECGRDREQLADFLIDTAIENPDIIVGLDFAFSLPAWFLEERGLRNAPELWDLASREAERWLRECQPPFWGRPGKKRPQLPDDLRRTDRLAPAVGGIRPKSVFQVGGAGAVGTGSLRGMAFLKRLTDSGFAVWPFHEPGRPLLIEIYPRLLTGPVNKGNQASREAYLAANLASLDDRMLHVAASSEDAFDAAVSALVMDAARAELEALVATGDPVVRLEGWIWSPEMTVPKSASEDSPAQMRGDVPLVTQRLVRTAEPDDWRLVLRSMLPKPVIEHGDEIIVGGDPCEVIVRLLQETITVGRGGASSSGESAEVVAEFERSSAHPRDVAQAVINARAARLAAYKWCLRCRQVFPPERMIPHADVCRKCS